ncbi:mechanosensitive ion channel family protein [candidate division KSB1 bacterium]|nr:mechanosensitive ion channel family protein [candidate division KSB1 bacterium]NIR72237.1 mechanosensitive ion channel family protein [candidate division KSB1 bacterium]NIS26303.1 mechanosensitive ion channel family protein [candidate division KSB1 bacterium]NIT73066.1 mechanosensitive ion channel family protein [candidate division KSB1 bacterium]NIU26973.1 mechanosensitive ion channel family protein [candidate division KSB1 bacterium]
MDTLIQWLRNLLGFSHEFQTKLVASFLAIFFLWLIRAVILIIVARRVKKVGVQYRWRKTSTYVAFGLAVFIIGRIWYEGFQSLSTYLGLLSAGLAIALQVPLVNLAGWAFILWRRPFAVGDRIQIGNYRGDVIDQRIFMFTLMEIGNWVDADQSTGRVIHIPNGKVFSDVLANYSKGFQYIWNEIPVLITFESNWEKAKKVLLRIGTKHGEHLTKRAEKKVRQAARKVMIFFTKLTPTVYTTVKDSGVLLTIRYLCEPRRRRTSEQEIWEDILRAFAECDDIDFAYPSQRFYNNLLEGKPGAKPSTNGQSEPAEIKQPTK